MNGRYRGNRLKGSWVYGVIGANPALCSIMMMFDLHALTINGDTYLIVPSKHIKSRHLKVRKIKLK